MKKKKNRQRSRRKTDKEEEEKQTKKKKKKKKKKNRQQKKKKKKQQSQNPVFKMRHSAEGSEIIIFPLKILAATFRRTDKNQNPKTRCCETGGARNVLTQLVLRIF